MQRALDSVACAISRTAGCGRVTQCWAISYGKQPQQGKPTSRGLVSATSAYGRFAGLTFSLPDHQTLLREGLGGRSRFLDVSTVGQKGTAPRKHLTL